MKLSLISGRGAMVSHLGCGPAQEAVCQLEPFAVEPCAEHCTETDDVAERLAYRQPASSVINCCQTLSNKLVNNLPVLRPALPGCIYYE